MREDTPGRHSGREPCPYDVAEACDLPGLHADNMMAGLGAGEKPRYLLYSPIWEGKSAPFGITAEPASHAVAVTHDRFVISRDFHAKSAKPELRTIPFSNVIYVQLGSSFCLGWFAVRFAERGPAACELMLFPAIGRDHFAAAVREYRSAIAHGRGPDPAQPAPTWDSIWGQDRLQAERMRELLVRGERPICALHSSELWVEQRSLWKSKWRCISYEGLLLATNTGIFHLSRETYDRPTTWNIGMNVLCVPYETVQSALIGQKVILGRRLHCLQLTLARKNASTCLEVPFAEADTEAGQAVVEHLAGAESSGSNRQVQVQSK